MRRTLLASFALAFMAYWFWTAEFSSERESSIQPLLPSFIQTFPSLRRSTPPASPPRPSADTAALKKWLAAEAVKVGRIDEQPSLTVIRLKKKALTLKPADLDYLKETATNPGATGDERFLSVYMIGLSESAAAKQVLREISETPVPTTSNDRAYSDEVVIRAHAMESLIQRQSQEESVQFLRDLLGHTTDASIARHARYLLTKL